MTYNLLGAQADGAVYSEWAGWSARLAQIHPDVVVVEEAQADDIGALVVGSGGAYRIAAYGLWPCDAKGNPEGVGILVRADLVTGASGVRSLGSSCQDPTMRRVLAWADVELSTGPVRVYGTHLTAGSGGAAASRDNQIRELRSVIAADDPFDARRWILAGDVNATPASAAYRALVGDNATAPFRFVDTYAVASPDAGDPARCPTVADGSAAAAALLDDPAHVRACGYSAGWPKDDNFIGCDLLSLCQSWALRRDVSVRERIDDVFVAASGPVSVTGAWMPNRADADWAAPGAEWYRLSDHLPVVVDLAVS